MSTFNSIMSDPCNQRCIDCGAPRPQWAIANWGCFICIECAGRFHRRLGVHISQIRSVKMDAWTQAQLDLMANSGNAYVQAMFFPALPDDMNPWKCEDVASRLTLEFVEAKYTRKLFFVHEGE